MSPLAALSPDQRAVLQLLLKQGKSYDELAGLLRIDPSAVRDRAVTALEALGPRDGQPPAPERRAEIADYLLGQQSASARASTRSYLEGSASGRAWARVVAGELRGGGIAAPDALPEIPAEGAEVEEAFGALQARTARREEVQRSSKLGGALLLAGIGIVLAVVLVWALTSGGDDKGGSASTPTTASTATTAPTTSTSSTTPQVLAQVNLTPPQGGPTPKALGVLNVLEQGGQKALALQAQGLPKTTKSSFYALWLTGGPNGKTRRVGFAPAVGSNGRTAGVQSLPSDAASYTRVILSRETSTNPKTPGTTVLSGALQLPSG